MTSASHQHNGKWMSRALSETILDCIQLGGPINLPDDSDHLTCLFLQPLLTPLTHTSFLFQPPYTALSSINLLFFHVPGPLYLYHCPKCLPKVPFSACLNPTCLSSVIMEIMLAHTSEDC